MEVKRRKNKKIVLRRRLLLGVAAAALIVLLALGGKAISDAVKKAGYRVLDENEIAAALERGRQAGQSTGEAEKTEVEDPEADRPEAEGLAEAAVSLVGKVHYFWGGKSSALGMDPRWGEITEVTSTGSETSGTLRPFGLDCSGFVSWCFIQLGYSPQEVEELVGNGTWNQWDRTQDIPWKQLRLGDFVFMNRYPTDQGNHIGICVGFEESGAPVFAHCSSGFDNVVVTTAGDVFRYARRPNVLAQAQP